jgi:hypothetical protein
MGDELQCLLHVSFALLTTALFYWSVRSRFDSNIVFMERPVHSQLLLLSIRLKRLAAILCRRYIPCRKSYDSCPYPQPFGLFDLLGDLRYFIKLHESVSAFLDTSNGQAYS